MSSSWARAFFILAEKGTPWGWATWHRLQSAEEELKIHSCSQTCSQTVGYKSSCLDSGQTNMAYMSYLPCRYASKQEQRADWKSGHKQECQAFQAASQTIAGKAVHPSDAPLPLRAARILWRKQVSSFCSVPCWCSLLSHILDLNTHRALGRVESLWAKSNAFPKHMKKTSHLICPPLILKRCWSYGTSCQHCGGCKACITLRKCFLSFVFYGDGFHVASKFCCLQAFHGHAAFARNSRKGSLDEGRIHCTFACQGSNKCLGYWRPRRLESSAFVFPHSSLLIWALVGRCKLRFIWTCQ